MGTVHSNKGMGEKKEGDRDMSDYIDRQTVLQCIKESRENIDWGQSEDGDAFLHYSAALYRTIASKECLPSADVEPVKHGRWIPCKYGDYHWHRCSACGVADKYIETISSRGIDLESVRNYCPNCGARMDEK